MGDEDVPVEEKPQGEGEAVTASEEGAKRDEKKKKKTWEEKRVSVEKKKKLQYMPFGSDPCLKIRAKGQKPKPELSNIKGSEFPWYEKTRKTRDVVKENEKKEAKEKKREIKAVESEFKNRVKAHKEYLQRLSEQVRLRRIYKANKPPDCDETFEAFAARIERKRQAKERLKREEEKLKNELEEEEKRFKEEEERRKEKKKQKTEKEKHKKDEQRTRAQISWPGSYPISVTEDFIMMLKYIIEAEYETKHKEKKKVVIKPPSKKDRIIKEFSSFLDVLFMSNEMMKEKVGCGGEKQNTNDDLSPIPSVIETASNEEETLERPEEVEAEDEAMEITE